jgi:hypothetical protein
MHGVHTLVDALINKPAGSRVLEYICSGRQRLPAVAGAAGMDNLTTVYKLKTALESAVHLTQ